MQLQFLDEPFGQLPRSVAQGPSVISSLVRVCSQQTPFSNRCRGAPAHMKVAVAFLSSELSLGACKDCLNNDSLGELSHRLLCRRIVNGKISQNTSKQVRAAEKVQDQTDAPVLRQLQGRPRLRWVFPHWTRSVRCWSLTTDIGEPSSGAGSHAGVCAREQKRVDPSMPYPGVLGQTTCAIAMRHSAHTCV